MHDTDYPETGWCSGCDAPPNLSTCGCRQCGGSRAAEDARLARRVVAFAGYIRATHEPDLRNRSVRPGVYERLLMGHSWSAPR